MTVASMESMKVERRMEIRKAVEGTPSNEAAGLGWSPDWPLTSPQYLTQLG